jgi:hypothetical protein
MIDLTLTLVIALTFFAVLCSIAALTVAVFIAAKLTAIQNTEYKVIPVETPGQTSGLEKLEAQIKEAQDSLRQNLGSVGLDPEDLV